MDNGKKVILKNVKINLLVIKNFDIYILNKARSSFLKIYRLNIGVVYILH